MDPTLYTHNDLDNDQSNVACTSTVHTGKKDNEHSKEKEQGGIHNSDILKDSWWYSDAYTSERKYKDWYVFHQPKTFMKDQISVDVGLCPTNETKSQNISVINSEVPETHAKCGDEGIIPHSSKVDENMKLARADKIIQGDGEGTGEPQIFDFLQLHNKHCPAEKENEQLVEADGNSSDQMSVPVLDSDANPIAASSLASDILIEAFESVRLEGFTTKCDSSEDKIVGETIHGINPSRSFLAIQGIKMCKMQTNVRPKSRMTVMETLLLRCQQPKNKKLNQCSTVIPKSGQNLKMNTLKTKNCFAKTSKIPRPIIP